MHTHTHLHMGGTTNTQASPGSNQRDLLLPHQGIRDQGDRFGGCVVGLDIQRVILHVADGFYTHLPLLGKADGQTHAVTVP